MTTDQLNDILVFCCGTLGACAPEILRLYALRNKPPKKGFSYFYVLITVIYAMLGGTLAILLQASNFRSAFYDGITMPLVISAMVRKKQTYPYFANSKGGTSKQPRYWSELIRTHANGIFGQDKQDMED